MTSYLEDEQEIRLFKVLKEHNDVLKWAISDIKGITPTICMHKIRLEDDTKPSREIQRKT